MALKYMRDNLKSLTWVLWATIAVLFGLVFFEWGGYDSTFQGDDPVAATVGGEVVTMAEFRQEYQNLERTYQQIYGERFDRDLMRQFLPKQALDQLINRKILLLEAERIGLLASDREVQDVILSYPVFKDDSGQFVGKEKYVEILRSNRMSADQFETETRQSVLLTKLDDILAETVYITDEEVEEAYREEAERATIRYIQLPATEFGDVQADDSEVAAYFEDHREDYALPEQRVVNYLLVDTVTLRKKLSDEIGDDELQAYYDEHQDEFTNQEQVRARHILLKVTPDRPKDQAESELAAIRARIEAGEDFAALARELSEDEGSAQRGGDLSYFGRDQMVKPFEDAAFGAQVNQLVGPVESDFGYHLIEVLDKREGGLQPFEQVKARVRSRAVGTRIGELAENKAKEIADVIEKDGIDTAEGLQALAEKEELTWTKSDPIGQDDTITGLGRAPEFNQKAFELQAGGVSEPVKVPRGWAILHLAEVLPPRTPELDDVRQQVKNATDKDKQSAAAVERLAALRKELESGASDLETLATSLGLEVQDGGEFGRFGRVNGLGANREVIDAALASEAGAVGGPIRSAQGAVLYEVVERKTFDAAEFEERRDALRESRERQQLAQLKQSLIEVRRRDLKPGYGRQVIETFELQPGDQAGAAG